MQAHYGQQDAHGNMEARKKLTTHSRTCEIQVAVTPPLGPHVAQLQLCSGPPLRAHAWKYQAHLSCRKCLCFPALHHRVQLPLIMPSGASRGHPIHGCLLQACFPGKVHQLAELGGIQNPLVEVGQHQRDELFSRRRWWSFKVRTIIAPSFVMPWSRCRWRIRPMKLP